jgi:hypothetical protein
MFIEMSNSRSSGYPLMNVTKDGVDGVISLNCFVDSWVWQSLILNFMIIFLVLIIFISPLIIVLLLRWLILLIFIYHLHHLEPDPHLRWVEMLAWKMMVDLVLVWALQIP